jgi:nitroreductase
MTSDKTQSYPNTTIETLMTRRSIRAFDPTPLNPDVVATLEGAAQRAATSRFDCAWSAIKIIDPAIAQQLAIIGKQTYIAQAPLLYVFVVDLHRNERIATGKGVDTSAAGNDALHEQYSYNQAHDDAVLALHAMETAAESLGLGTVVLGSILNDMPALVELLHLPQLVFPVLGLAIGKSAQSPALKPRMDAKFQIFENRYPSDEEMPAEQLVESLADFDEVVHRYYDLRNKKKPVDRFTDQVAAKASDPAPAQKPFADYAKKQGFKF